LPGWRRWQSDLSFTSQWDFKAGTLQQQWRGVPMLKHPIEAVLYPMLFWEQKPGTIFEIGTSSGGSAIYFGDLMKVYGSTCRIITMDVKVPAPPIRPDNVEFLYGDSTDLGKTLTPEKLASCARPWLVIEDASHEYAHTLAALRFFDPLMRPGEYIVVEDGNVTHMGDEKRFDGGPQRAIEEFLAETNGRYVIDASYCDRFGHNVTGNPNGYLRRV
jgi:cephalosporin hydroxylase